MRAADIFVALIFCFWKPQEGYVSDWSDKSDKSDWSDMSDVNKLITFGTFFAHIVVKCYDFCQFC